MGKQLPDRVITAGYLNISAHQRENDRRDEELDSIHVYAKTMQLGALQGQIKNYPY